MGVNTEYTPVNEGIYQDAKIIKTPIKTNEQTGEQRMLIVFQTQSGAELIYGVPLDATSEGARKARNQMLGKALIGNKHTLEVKHMQGTRGGTLTNVFIKEPDYVKYDAGADSGQQGLGNLRSAFAANDVTPVDPDNDIPFG